MRDATTTVGDNFQLGETNLRALIERAPDGIFVADLDGRYTYVNEAGCAMLGYSRDEIIGKTIVDLIPAEDVARLGRSKSAMLEGRAHVDEWTLRRKDGTWLPVEVNANILPGGQWQGFVRDISERKALQAEREALFGQIQSDQRLLNAVFDILPVGVWIADGSGRIASNNPAGERIWSGARHVPVAEFGEYKGWWIESGEPIAADEWALARALAQGTTSLGELVRIQCFDGSFKTIINSAAPLRDDQGGIAGAIVVNEDITALYQAQEQLRAAVRDREEILAVVTHDLRNPLGGLMLTASFLEQQASALPGGETLRARAASMIEVTRSMSALVDDLLAIAIAGPGRSMLKIAPVESALLLARAAEAARPMFAREGIRLEVEPAGELPLIHVDSNRVLRVFANLLDNALKFTESPGMTVLRAEALSGSVRFCVANSGPALPAEALESMFQPFWQAGREDRRGAGLGLSICRSIVEAHGGSIWAEPASGRRVRICFLLPYANPEASGAAAGEPASTYGLGDAQAD